MRVNSIKKYLRPYRIRDRRSTLRNAFVSAIAPHDVYDRGRVEEALRQMGQDPSTDLTCVYCGADAACWDHVFPRVQKKQFSGHGHTLGNLLPCCRACNESKRGIEWTSFLETKLSQKLIDEQQCAERHGRIRQHLDRYHRRGYTQEQIEKLCPQEMARWNALWERLEKVIYEADVLAEDIRAKLIAHEGGTLDGPDMSLADGTSVSR